VTPARLLLDEMLSPKIGTGLEDRGVGEDIPFDVIAERAQRQVARPMTITNLNWFSKYKVHARHVEKFGVGRVFVAGDAAHVHTPAGGQGMITGIQDAYNLAWKLALVIAAAAKPRLLDTCHPTHRMETLATLKTVTICPSYLTKLSPAWELFKVERPLGMAGPNRPRVMTSAGATSPRSVRGSVGSLTSRSRIWAAAPGRLFERTGE
jgi:2-polyprenyl-6-methoxyphenol hydroxylase-like FAD-dependent oxidoreductase